jgi:hypothetical protein
MTELLPQNQDGQTATKISNLAVTGAVFNLPEFGVKILLIIFHSVKHVSVQFL